MVQGSSNYKITSMPQLNYAVYIIQGQSDYLIAKSRTHALSIMSQCNK